MGSACTPVRDTNVHLNDTVEDGREVKRSGDRLEEAINRYQAEKEQLNKELENYKDKAEEFAKVQAQLTQQNNITIDELARVKAQLEAKDRLLVKHRLEAALHSKATLMAAVESESFAKQVKAGNLWKFNRTRKAKSAKQKWVWIDLYSCTKTNEGFETGYMVLNYSESKQSQLSNRAKIVSVVGEDVQVNQKFNGRCFIIEALVSGVRKEFVFACVDEKSRIEWVETIKKGFVEIEEETKSMYEHFVKKVEFSKEKLGISVEERLLEAEDDDKKLNNQDIFYTALTGNADLQDIKGTTSADNTEKETKPDDDGKAEENSKFREKVERDDREVLKNLQQPCELVVRKILDDDISSTGLVVESVVTSINDTTLRGLTYDEQLKIIISTKKPFTLTFAGPMHLKKKIVRTSAYPELLKKLTAEENNSVKDAFYELVKGTPFGNALDSSEDKVSVIAELLSNQRRLAEVLQSRVGYGGILSI